MKLINTSLSNCSFEVSKLLWKKGCCCQDGLTGWSEDGKNCISHHSSFYSSEKYPIDEITQALAIEWIRVNFKIWIRINSMDGKIWFFDIWDFRKDIEEQIIIDDENEFNSPKESTEHALLYALKNLIK